jgi:hypothetical protein
VALDDRVHRELERAARPADPSGVYEELVRRHERRRLRHRMQAGTLALALFGATIGGFLLLAQLAPGSEPAPPITPPPASSGTASPDPSASPSSAPDGEGQDIGLGFLVCDVTSVTGRFVAGIEGTAYVATGMDDTSRCPPLDGATQVLAVDVDGNGLSDTSYEPLECDQWCNAFAAPDVDRDGDDELLVQNVQFSIKGLKLFEVQLGDGGVGLGPVTVAPPGTEAFEGGTEPQLWLGGDEGNWDAIRCEPFEGGRALVSTTSSHPVDAPGDRNVIETWFVLEGLELRVVDVREYAVPVDDDTQPFLQTDGCGASFPYP